MSFVTLSPPPPSLYFREHNIDHGHIYKLVSTLCRFSILQETVRGEGLTGNRNTKFNISQMGDSGYSNQGRYT